MNGAFHLLAAAASGSALPGSQEFEFGRVAMMTPLYWALLVLAFVVVMGMVVYFCMRDCVELGGFIASILIFLRLGTFLGLLWIFLLPQWRVERHEVDSSRVVLLFDTSLSMAKQDDESQKQRRVDEVVRHLEQTNLLTDLRAKHDVVALTFDAQTNRVATLPRTTPPALPESARPKKETDSRGLVGKYWPGLIIVGVLGLVVAAIWLSTGLSHMTRVSITVPAVMIGLVGLLAWSFFGTDLWKLQRPQAEGPKQPIDFEVVDVNVDWKKSLEPTGRETRLGQALRKLVNDYRTEPISGIVVVTDGRNNSGIDAESAIDAAKSARIPILTVAIGSTREQAHVRLADFNVPKRAYPGDKYTIRLAVQATGLEGQEVDVKIESYADKGDPDTAKEEKAERLSLGADGEVIVLPIVLTPDDTGKRVLRASVIPPGGATEEEKKHLVSERVIEIVDHRTRVLLFAGGPTREYRFVRNQLRRDESMEVDVLLQTIEPGAEAVSQDARKILEEFPTLKRELREYDCIVAFDPDWDALDDEQADLLEQWVAKDAGGLIVLPGPIHTDDWVHSSTAKFDKIRGLYPVKFHSHFNIEEGEFDNDELRRVVFGKKTERPEFLWLTDAKIASEQAWDEFEGVYGYYNVPGAKPAANVYARLTDPSRLDPQAGPIFFASQFYGSGRVFYLGSGEMWRLRSLKEEYFETFYTKLIRHVSQGTLLRGNKRGMLLLEQEKYVVGDTVPIKAQLEDAAGDPLLVEAVVLEAVDPDGRLQSVRLEAKPNEKGAFMGQFPVLKEGTFELRLQMPDADEELTANIDVRLPDLENENTLRNDPLLAQISEATGGGKLFVGMAATLGSEEGPPLPARLIDRTRHSVKKDTPKSLWDNHWTLILICSLLCVEWIIRRLCKLA